MRNAPQSLRTKVLGRDPELQSGVLGPAAPLLHRLLAPQRPCQVEVQLGDRDFQGTGDGEQPLGRHVLEPALELREIGGRQPRGPPPPAPGGRPPPPPPPASPSPTASPSATSSASESPSPTLTATPSVVDPGFVPALAAIQMVGPRLGWAVGAHAIFGTTDGAHWTKQYASTEEFVGVDFISATTGWAVATRTLLGTTESGRTWRQFGEPRVPPPSTHFATATQGWGIAGGSDPQQNHGWLIPHDGATLVFTYDGGSTWSTLGGPLNPQNVCFSEPAQGWIGTPAGVFTYPHTNLGHNWSKGLQRPDQQPNLPQATLIQCAAP